MSKLIKAVANTIESARKNLSIERIGRAQTVLALSGYALLLLSEPALAQSLRATGESIFNTIYGVVGVFGGIAGLVAAINWKSGNFLGTRDPKQAFINVLLGTGLAFGIVGIIQFVKTSVGSSSGISGV